MIKIKQLKPLKLRIILTSDPNLHLLCIWKSEAAPLCQIYARLHFDAKQLEKELNRGWLNFWCLFF